MEKYLIEVNLEYKKGGKMDKIKLQKDVNITTRVIEYVLKRHESEKKRIQKLRRYYENNCDINARKQIDKNKPNNKLSHAYGTYITNTAVGYFLGKPISYKSDDNKELLKDLLDVFKYNDEIDHNTMLAKEASIYGYGVELQYIDEFSNIRLKCIKGEEIAIVYDNTIEENLNFAIRYFDEDFIEDNGVVDTITYIEVYTKDSVINYIKKNGVIVPQMALNNKGEVLENSHIREHFFSDVPCSIYINNDECMGDFERSTQLIDAYNLTQSDSANDFEYFTNCMLIVSGYVLDKEDAQSITDVRTLNFSDSEGKAEYLIKNIQDTALENYKNRLDNDIHKLSGIPNMSDESFGNNSSGISLQFKLMALENITGVKEAKFKKGLMRRIELICNALSIKKGQNNIFMDIVPVFTRTKPINLLEEAQRLQMLTGIYSQETILSISSEIDNPLEEIERKNRESQSIYDDYKELGAFNE
jgi:SPP1 family phage portal protein